MYIYEVRYTDGSGSLITVHRDQYPAGSGILMTCDTLKKLGVTEKNYRDVKKVSIRLAGTPDSKGGNIVGWEKIYLDYLKKKA